jgi:hypothetical protein
MDVRQAEGNVVRLRSAGGCFNLTATEQEKHLCGGNVWQAMDKVLAASGPFGGQERRSGARFVPLGKLETR